MARESGSGGDGVQPSGGGKPDSALESRLAAGAAEPPALGVVLSGGRGSRLGGAKATADLAGRPLISYPLATLAAAGLEAVVVAKPSSEPAEPTGVEVVVEAEEPRHPLAGIVTALRHAGRPVVVLGCDFPFVPPALVRALAEAPEPLLVPAPAGAVQPLVARWTPALLPGLEDALAREEPLRRTVAELIRSAGGAATGPRRDDAAAAPRLLGDADLAPFGDAARAFFNVNTPADIRLAATML